MLCNDLRPSELPAITRLYGPPPSMVEIILAVSVVTGVSPSRIRNGLLRGGASRARRMVWLLASRWTLLSSTEIGPRLGGTSHTARSHFRRHPITDQAELAAFERDVYDAETILEGRDLVPPRPSARWLTYSSPRLDAATRARLRADGWLP